MTEKYVRPTSGAGLNLGFVFQPLIQTIHLVNDPEMVSVNGIGQGICYQTRSID